MLCPCFISFNLWAWLPDFSHLVLLAHDRSYKSPEINGRQMAFKCDYVNVSKLELPHRNYNLNVNFTLASFCSLCSVVVRLEKSFEMNLQIS